MNPLGRSTGPGRVALFVAFFLVTSVAAPLAHAEPTKDRASAAGYFRLMARPDLDGGWSRLGLWNISGRLLNEGPWAALELKLDVLPESVGSNAIWSSVHAKIEGGSVRGVDTMNGSLNAYNLTQLYVLAGNILVDDVTWQLGTLHTYFGDLGLYDMKPSDLFWETVGLSMTYRNDWVDLMAGFGDSGYGIHGDAYSTVLSAGGSARFRIVKGLELGFGGQINYEPGVEGNRFAPHKTPLDEYYPLEDGSAQSTYEDFLRGEIVSQWARYQTEFQPEGDGLPSRDNVVGNFPKPESTSASSFKLVGYLGFGQLGPLKWNNLFVNFLKRHPQNVVTENYKGAEVSVFVTELTDEKYQINVGDELQLTVIHGVWDIVWGALLGIHYDNDNEIAPSDDDRFFYSSVLRNQVYLTDSIHFLLEGSWASEKSENGNLWRGHYDSIFISEDGRPNNDGLEFGDLDKRDTFQLKTGFIINPTGMGIFSRPSIRLLYGLQNSNMHNAFGNSFIATLDEANEFIETSDRHWHQIISLEAEAWF